MKNIKQELICIGCPMGCPLTVTMDEGQPLSVSGNTCPKGKTYAEKEVTNPTRIVTSTVKVEGGDRTFISVKTQTDIPKQKIFACMEEINRIVAKAPIASGDVLLENVAGTGVAVVATKAAGRM
ncbi:hypothetical protein C823_002976 [Eubacterium plexicaudatum ASF492]|uniref:4Fe-4S Mo/W bis-MGD-type domain-containing protein n=1 Tax=Eubacterium plexicaudatum ASF492 TaxID=1235802 RepID=N2AH28_9FIRM|nr:hypothetical protein C823_002976 [Eubacterium plexicaudatum ASF492]